MKLQTHRTPLRWFCHLFSVFVILSLSFAPSSLGAPVQGAIAGDVAFQPAASYLGRLRGECLNLLMMLSGNRYATETDHSPYEWGTMFGRPYQDVWLVDTRTGQRRKALEKVVRPNDAIRLGEVLVADGAKAAQGFFDAALESGCEGLVAKALESKYEAGARGFQWIKYKRDYKSEMTDTVDLVVVGAFAGRGKRAGTYGALLCAAYDRRTDTFYTACKLGTGFDDATLFALPQRFEPHKVKAKPARVESAMKADVWFEPAVVLEVLGAELTLSPVHTAAMGKVRKGAGLAVRFPRFTGKWREDRKAEDATSVGELLKMYNQQLRKVEGA